LIGKLSRLSASTCASLDITFRLGEKVTRISVEEQRGAVLADLESGKRVQGDALIYAVGRQGNADQLHLDAAGLTADGRGRLKVNEFFQTAVSHIYAAGDVIGFPALATNCVPYEVGIAKYSELAKSMMLGDDMGMLKLLFHRQTRKLLGVHALGQRATEIIHIGQAVLFYGGSIEYFRDTVFNYPTLAEAYKVAALNGLNKI
jgi:NAD(P) transhydrogenase